MDDLILRQAAIDALENRWSIRYGNEEDAQEFERFKRFIEEEGE